MNEGESDLDYRLGWPPGHFYSPIPSLSEVRARATEIFDDRLKTLPGIDMNDLVQLETFQRIVETYPDQPFEDEKQEGLRYFFDNPNFSWGEGIVLQGMTRSLLPRRFIEVGGGYSSCAVLDINELFFSNRMECTFIEPYPELLESLVKQGDLERARLIATPVQSVALEEFTVLESGDIVQIDSSHVSKVGSDVNHLLFSVLPLLRSGVYIHFHDITYPFEYPERWVYEGRAWNEAYLLRAFLQFNAAFEIVFFNSYFALRHPDMVERHVPRLRSNPGSSLWLRRL